MDPATEPREGSMQVRDGRTVAWTEWGDPHGRPLLQLPGTPGSRWEVRHDRSVWAERGLRVITTERPGFGRSTRLPGRRFREHADDLAAVLDHLGLERVHAMGASGAAPHVLALCQHHPDRVAAATVLGGMAPVSDDDLDLMHPENRAGLQRIRAGRLDEEEADLQAFRDAVLADPLAPFLAFMQAAPPADQAVLADPGFRAALARSVAEALAPGTGGWLDESVALVTEWDVDPSAVTTSVTWYHGTDDTTAPLAPARRLVERLPAGTFVEWAQGGHLTWYVRAGEVLDELLARG